MNKPIVMMNKVNIVILAAGSGTRMGATTPKVLQTIAGKPMLDWVIDECHHLKAQCATTVTVIASAQLAKRLPANVGVNIAIQQQPNGTGASVMAGFEQFPELHHNPITLVLCADTPLLQSPALHAIIQQINTQVHASVIGFNTTKPNKYGRLICDNNNHLQEIIEFKDLPPSQQVLTTHTAIMCNSGIYAFNTKSLLSGLAKIDNNNNSGEYYLTSVIEHITNDSKLCQIHTLNDDSIHQCLGVNTMIELAQCENIMQDRLREKAMLQGVKMLDPTSVYLAHDSIIGADSIIHPNVVFGNNVTIGNKCIIKSFTTIDQSTIGDDVTIGPCANIRPDCDIAASTKIGNFVEMKKATMGIGSKASHLSYLGDITIGAHVNVGAGSYTCNYDGYNKHRTNIEDGAFLGVNTVMIAPITIGKGAVIGAGSTLTTSVPAHDLALARSTQINLDGKGKKYHINKRILKGKCA